jgi:hypothetical protein
MSRVIAFAATLTMSAALLLTTTSPAAAHERRAVGPYQFVVGFLSEPAFQGEPNAATVRISDTRITPAKPVEGLEKTLTISVTSGGLSNAFTGTTRAVFGQPGLYALDFIPTVGGSYTFVVKGKVESLDVNEKFESGPGRFNDVEAQTALQYPAKAPVAADLSQQLNDLRSGVDRVQLIALAGLAVAIVLPLALFAMSRRSRS